MKAFRREASIAALNCGGASLIGSPPALRASGGMPTNSLGGAWPAAALAETGPCGLRCQHRLPLSCGAVAWGAANIVTGERQGAICEWDTDSARVGWASKISERCDVVTGHLNLSMGGHCTVD